MELILVRHGKPITESKGILDAKGFSNCLKKYECSEIDPKSFPCNALLVLIENSYIVSSELPRALHSANIAIRNNATADKKSIQRFSSLNEMQLPNVNLPFKLAISMWLTINRLLWFVGFSRNVESYRCAKQRADQMAKELISLCEQHKSVVVFGHGLMNCYIKKSLIKRGWKTTIKLNGAGYWSFTKLTS
tara:strand:- start:88 stop:660 length:573 start_codon:yes stop_codon:yes gene_type:complete